MADISSPPSTPARSLHRRHPSSLDSQPNRSPTSRRSSTAAFSPSTPRSSHGFQSTSLANDFSELGGDANGGLGSLADELADFDSDEEGVSEIPIDASFIGDDEAEEAYVNGVKVTDTPRDSGISGISMNAEPDQTAGLLSPMPPGSRRHHRRKGSEYDGSDYGNDSDFEMSDTISPALESQMAAVEGLARRGMEENGSADDKIVARVTDALKDLGSQAGIEGGATRLTTAHASLITHVTHQTRLITSTASTLFSPLSPPLPTDLIESLLPLIATTLSSIPPSPTSPYFALHKLSDATRDLINTLNYLADTLHMSRQTTNTAARRLRTAKEVLAEWRREEQEREDGVLWIESGEWDRKLEERQCGAVCRDVVSGFEEVCEGWRERLVAQEVGAG